MTNKILKCFLNRAVGILCAAALAISLLRSYTYENMYLEFINAMTVFGLCYLSLGFLYWLWAEGEFQAFYRFKAKKDADKKKADLKPDVEKGKTNPLLYAGIIITVIAVIMTIFYKA